MFVKTLGGLSLEGSSFTRPKPLLLLVYLALEGPRSRRELADLFFMSARDPRDSLSTALRLLNRNVPGGIVTDREFVHASIACDAKTFLETVAVQPADALTLYHGPFLQGIDVPLDYEVEEWMFKTREHLAVTARATYLKLADTAMKQHQADTATHCLQAALNLTDAPELPSKEESRLQALIDSLQTAGAPAQASSQDEHGKVPVYGTSFVGRDEELLVIRTHLTDATCRLLTLHGPGGIGKSRLAAQAAHGAIAQGLFRDGVFFTELSDLTSEQVPHAIARAVGCRLNDHGKPLEQLKYFLKHKHLLIVLDNYEHLMESATLPAELIHACANVTLLVTSREPLHLQEEYVLDLSGLTIPAAQVTPGEAEHLDAVQLFLQRTKQVCAAKTVRAQDLPHILTICRFVQGYPLGIELAAAWTRTLPIADIAKEISENPDFLSSQNRNIPDRHQSIRAVFEHSWRLLTLHEQTALKQLSIFRGGFTRDDAIHVAKVSLPVLAALVDKSLLHADANGRFHFHPLLHLYAQEKLEPATQSRLRQHHAEYYLQFAENAATGVKGAQQHDWLEQLDYSHHNLRAALTWFIQQEDAEHSLRLGAALRWFWLMRGHYQEGRMLLDAGLTLSSPSEARTRGAALSTLGVLACRQGDYGVARTKTEEALALQRQANDRPGLAASLRLLGLIQYREGEYAQAQASTEQSLDILRELNDQEGIANSLLSLGNILLDAGNPQAQSLYQESLAISQAIGDELGAAYALDNLGVSGWYRGDLEAAKRYTDDVQAAYDKLGSRFGHANVLHRRGLIALAEGEAHSARTNLQQALCIKRELNEARGIAFILYDLAQAANILQEHQQAEMYLREALTIAQTISAKPILLLILEGAATLLKNTGDPEGAVRLYAAAAAGRESHAIPLPPVVREAYRQKLEELATMLAPDLFERSWNEGRTMSLARATEWVGAWLLPHHERPLERLKERI